MGKTGEFHTSPGCKAAELKEKKPCQKLRLPAVRMSEGNDTPAFPFQRPLKGIKKILLAPQNHFGHSIKNEEIRPDKELEEDYNKQ
jgi:hypothetical protein